MAACLIAARRKILVTENDILAEKKYC